MPRSARHRWVDPIEIEDDIRVGDTVKCWQEQPRRNYGREGYVVSMERFVGKKSMYLLIRWKGIKKEEWVLKKRCTLVYRPEPKAPVPPPVITPTDKPLSEARFQED